MNKKVFVTRKIPEIGIRMLLNKGIEVDVYPKDMIATSKELVELLQKKSYDAVLCLLTDKINASVFDAAPSVKMYANYATGFDNIDIVEAKKRGIKVSNAPAELSSAAVAEHTIALMLSLFARIVEADDFVRQGKYKGWAPMNFIGTNLKGKTLGLIGAGRIGEQVACFAKALGLNVIYTDIVRNSKLEEAFEALYQKEVKDVLKNADVVSLHVPLLETTKHLINAETLALMKPTSFLINTSRGGVIDEKALVKALEEKVISAAALDVFEFEPEVSSELIKLKNVVLTPHIASANDDARNQMAEIASHNIIDFFEGKTPRNIVNN